jgi:K+-transporting ATPase ATPase B chain
MTEGTLTFPIASDVAECCYYSSTFITAIPALQGLNIMGLHSQESAILSQ